MTPGTLNIPIYKGARWAHTLTFLQSGTQTPVSISGLEPFVMTFKNEAGYLLANALVTVMDAPNGVLSVVLTAAQTDTFPLGAGKASVGLRNNNNDPYLQATLDVLPFTPDPRII